MPMGDTAEQKQHPLSLRRQVTQRRHGPGHTGLQELPLITGDMQGTVGARCPTSIIPLGLSAISGERCSLHFKDMMQTMESLNQGHTAARTWRNWDIRPQPDSDACSPPPPLWFSMRLHHPLGAALEVRSLLATITRKPIFHGTAPNQEWFHALSASGALPGSMCLESMAHIQALN